MVKIIDILHRWRRQLFVHSDRTIWQVLNTYRLLLREYKNNLIWVTGVICVVI